MEQQVQRGQEQVARLRTKIDQLEADASKHKKAVLGDTNADGSAAEKTLRRRAPKDNAERGGAARGRIASCDARGEGERPVERHTDAAVATARAAVSETVE